MSDEKALAMAKMLDIYAADVERIVSENVAGIPTEQREELRLITNGMKNMSRDLTSDGDRRS